MRNGVVAAILAAILLIASSAQGAHAIGLEPANQKHHKSLREELIDKLSTAKVPRSEAEKVLLDPRVTTELLPQPEGKSDLYSKESVERGLVFLETYRIEFEIARNTFGRSPYVTASIMRNETNFGKYSGVNPVLRTLYWMYVLSLEEKRREAAVNRLSLFIRLFDNGGWHMFDIKGSSDGAIGMPQFMPYTYKLLLESPYRRVIDVNHDGKIDLNDPREAILATAWLNFINDRNRGTAADIFAYNHDPLYVRMVLKYAQLLKEASCANGNMFNDQSCYEHPHLRHLIRHRRLHHKRKH